MYHRQFATMFVLAAVALTVSGCMSGGRGRRPDQPFIGHEDDAGSTTSPGSDGGVVGADAGPEATCTDGRTSCGGTCVDLRTDSANCGECGAVCGGTCSDGVCTGACAEPRTDCGGSCVDTSSDPRNCGGCGISCSAGQLCDAGTCTTTTTCTGGRMLCGEACVDTSANVSNCGACGRACGVGQICAGGECGCSGVSRLCGGVCRDFSSDASNCGSCGHACGAGQYCSGGTCMCEGATLCGTACVDTLTDSANCGGCGRSCTAGTTCRSGSCATVGGAGDTCTAPLSVSGAGGSVAFRLDDATPNYVRSCGGTTATSDRAFTFRPTRSGTATFAAEGAATTTDLVLEVFTSSSCSTTYSLGCNDDRASGDYRPLLSASVTAGTTYYVVVATYADPAPAESITLTITAP